MMTQLFVLKSSVESYPKLTEIVNPEAGKISPVVHPVITVFDLSKVENREEYLPVKVVVLPLVVVRNKIKFLVQLPEDDIFLNPSPSSELKDSFFAFGGQFSEITMAYPREYLKSMLTEGNSLGDVIHETYYHSCVAFYDDVESRVVLVIRLLLSEKIFMGGFLRENTRVYEMPSNFPADTPFYSVLHQLAHYYTLMKEETDNG